MGNFQKLAFWTLVSIALVGGSWLLYHHLSGQTDSTPSAAEDTGTPSDGSSEDTAEEKVEAPDFTVYDADGNAVSASDFAGKPMLINFWASWCSPCKGEMPDLETVYNEYKDNVVFLMVNMTDGSRETTKTASAYIAEQGYSFPVYYDTDQSAAYAYSVTSIPSNVFVDSDGFVYAGYRGALDLDTFRSHLDVISAVAQPSAFDTGSGADLVGVGCCALPARGSCT